MQRSNVRPVALFSALVALAMLVSDNADIRRADARALASAHAEALHGDAWWSATVTHLADVPTIFVLTSLGVIVLSALGREREALTLGLAVAMTEVAVAVLKRVVERARPPASVAVSSADGFGFPSGHAAASVAAYGVLAAILVASLHGRARFGVLLGATLVVVAIGASRVLLGVHYPTDVIAGWLCGATFSLIAWRASAPLEAWREAWMGSRN